VPYPGACNSPSLHAVFVAGHDRYASKAAWTLRHTVGNREYVCNPKNSIRASQKGEPGHITAGAAATAARFFWLLPPTSSEAGHTKGGR